LVGSGENEKCKNIILKELGWIKKFSTTTIQQDEEDQKNHQINNNNGGFMEIPPKHPNQSFLGISVYFFVTDTLRHYLNELSLHQPPQDQEKDDEIDFSKSYPTSTLKDFIEAVKIYCEDISWEGNLFDFYLVVLSLSFPHFSLRYLSLFFFKMKMNRIE